MFYYAAIFASLALLSTANDCNIAPRFWCETEEIATKCGVLSNCANRLYPTKSAEPVKVGTYFESLCPDSIRFITTQLYPTWLKLKDTGIMESRIVPFGKAVWREQEDGSYNFYCQHGKQECIGNIIQNCVIQYAHNKTEIYLPVIDCMMGAPDVVGSAQTCVEDSNVLEWNPINECSEKEEGSQLLYASGVETKALEPPLNWVPWLTINGVHTDEIQAAGSTDLLSLICETYQGVKPDECKSSTAYLRISEKLEFKSRDNRL